MRVRPRAWEVALFAVAFALAGCVALALAWATEPVHRYLLAAQTPIQFTSPTGGLGATLRGDEASALHAGWVAYVTGRSEQQPARDTDWFTVDERGHMADVRAVFIAAQALALVGLLTLVALGWHARGRLPPLARGGAIWAAAAVIAIGAAGALAFDAVFLLFHEILFPQGNFLFPPESNLIRLYPERYWYAMTLGIAVSFLALAALVAVVAHVAMRRSAIVSPR